MADTEHNPGAPTGLAPFLRLTSRRDATTAIVVRADRILQVEGYGDDQPPGSYLITGPKPVDREHVAEPPDVVVAMLRAAGATVVTAPEVGTDG